MQDKIGESARSCRARVDAIVFALVNPWRLPVRDCLSQLDTALDEVLGAGDINSVSYLAIWCLEMPSHAQLPLPLAIEKQSAHIHMLKRRKLAFSEVWGQAWSLAAKHTYIHTDLRN